MPNIIRNKVFSDFALETTKDTIQYVRPFWAKTAYEQLAINRHNGLEVTGQIYARPDAYFDADNDDAEQVSKYKAKVQAELGWNIINSKFYQGKEKRNKVALANELTPPSPSTAIASHPSKKATSSCSASTNATHNATSKPSPQKSQNSASSPTKTTK